MNRSPVLYSVSALLLGGCAAMPEAMSPTELAECLQPNRRVVVEVVGQVVKPPAKKPEAKPQEAAVAKPTADAPAPKPQVAAAKPEAAAAKPAADAPAPKPEKPVFAEFEEKIHVQGNTAFDPSGAALKDGGKAEIDGLLALLKKRAVRVGAIIVAGHSDRLEARAGLKALSEERAKAVKDYLVLKGADEKLIFWEGKEARDPVPVTKFCA